MAALALFAFVGLVAAFASSVAWPEVARAHETEFAYLSALTVIAGATEQTRSPGFSSTVEHYTVLAADPCSPRSGIRRGLGIIA